MATSSKAGDPKKRALSQPLTDETTIFYMETLTFDLVVNILCRLPVKVLMKVRCVCKFLNSLISDPKFAKEHLRCSRTLLNRHHLLLCRRDNLVWDSRLTSVFNSASTTFPEMQLIFPVHDVIVDIIDSCNGIICFCYYTREGDFDSILVWNPSIRKFKLLPPLEKELLRNATYGFGYDRLTDSYKVVAVCCYQFDRSNYVCKTQVMVHTLGTNTWRSIQSFPSTLLGFPDSRPGKFVSRTVNWVVQSAPSSWVIVSIDLGNESYKELLQPDYGGVDVCDLTLGVLRDSLCILAHTKTSVFQVWLMKDYGNKESWTELFAITNNSNSLLGAGAVAYAHYILEDDQLLMNFVDEVYVYNPKNSTRKFLEIPCIFPDWYDNHVYIESLISP